MHALQHTEKSSSRARSERVLLPPACDKKWVCRGPTSSWGTLEKDMPGRNIGQSKSILSTRVGLSRHMSTSRALRAQAQWTKPFVAVGGESLMMA